MPPKGKVSTPMKNKTREEYEAEIRKWKNKFEGLESKVDDIIKVNEERNARKTNAEADTRDTYEEIMNVKKELTESIKGMKEVQEKWSRMVQIVDQRQNQTDQHNRRNSVLVHGYDHLPDLKGFLFKKKILEDLISKLPSLEVDINMSHVDEIHEFKTKRARRKKVVIIKFTNRWAKHLVFKAKRDLKSTGMVITEHLTPHTLNLLNAAKQVAGEGNVWTFDTVVYTYHNEMKFQIKSDKDIETMSLESPPTEDGFVRSSYGYMEPTASITSYSNNNFIPNNSNTRAPPTHAQAQHSPIQSDEYPILPAEINNPPQQSYYDPHYDPRYRHTTTNYGTNYSQGNRRGRGWRHGWSARGRY